MSINILKKKAQSKKWAKAGFLFLLVMSLAQACGTPRIPEGARIIEDTPTRNIPTKTPYVTATIPAGSVLTATASALQTHTGAVRFVSYNIQYGGQDKLPQVMSILKAYNADVLAIQEANGTSVDKNGNTYDLVLFSKLEIKNSEVFSNVSNCLIRAEVITPSGKSVQVFATHIRSNFDEVGCQNVENIAKAMASYVGGQSILMGDMTIPPPGVIMGYPQNQIACPPVLESAGLSFFADVSQVDHVWVSQAMLDLQFYKLPNPSTEPLVPKNIIRNTSNHSPLAVDFYFP